jgi:hypothetical protein
VTEGFDWFAYGAGFMSALGLMLVLRWRRSGKAHRPSLVVAPPQPITLSADIRAQVLLMKADGRAIEAIKLVRSRTRCDLKQAKDTVDALR